MKGTSVSEPILTVKEKKIFGDCKNCIKLNVYLDRNSEAQLI